MQLSPEILYGWVYADARAGGQLYVSLVRHHKKRRRQRLGGRGLIPDRVGIAYRPALVDARRRWGDGERATLRRR